MSYIKTVLSQINMTHGSLIAFALLCVVEHLHFFIVNVVIEIYLSGVHRVLVTPQWNILNLWGD